MKVLVACEESQRVCIAFRERGHEAYSCDIEPCSGGHPEWHIKSDVRYVLNGGVFKTQNNKNIAIDRWDLIIAHPPCTYLSNVATRSHSIRCTPLNKINGRTLNRIDGARFFMECINANCDKIAVENPVGIMNTLYRKADQIIEPYYFAESIEDVENYTKKRTCLWLKGLNPLEKTNNLTEPNLKELYGVNSPGKAKSWTETISRNKACERSKTFPGIAKAMAEQWG